MEEQEQLQRPESVTSPEAPVKEPEPELGVGGIKALQAERQTNKQLQSEINALSKMLEQRQRQLEESQKSLAAQYEEKTALRIQQKEEEIERLRSAYDSKVAELSSRLEEAEEYQRQVMAQQMINAITTEFANEFSDLKPQYRELVLSHAQDGLTIVDGRVAYRLVDQNGNEQYYPLSVLKEYYRTNYADMFDAPPVVNGVNGIRDLSRSSGTVGGVFVYDDTPTSQAQFLQNIEQIAKGQLQVRRAF